MKLLFIIAKWLINLSGTLLIISFSVVIANFYLSLGSISGPMNWLNDAMYFIGIRALVLLLIGLMLQKNRIIIYTIMKFKIKSITTKN
jgi:hypothetical protein